ENGSPEEGIPGDVIGVLKSWKPPQATDPVGMFSGEDKEFWVGLLLKDSIYRYDAQSPAWFGRKIAERLGLDLKKVKHLKMASSILDELVENGTFRLRERRDQNGRVRKGVEAGKAQAWGCE